MEVTQSGAKLLSNRFKKLAENTRDLSPAYKAFGDWAVGETVSNIGRGVDFDGKAFAPLKPETIARRQAVIEDKLIESNAYRKTKKGKYTKGALRKQIAQAGNAERPLMDSRKMVRSVRMAFSKHSMRFKALGYLTIAMTGAGEAGIEKRNPTPFDRVRGKWVLHRRARAKLREFVKAGIYR